MGMIDKRPPHLNIQVKPGESTTEYMPVEEHKRIVRVLERPQLKFHTSRGSEPGWWLEVIVGPIAWNVYWHWAYAPSNWKRLYFSRSGVIVGPLTIMAPSNWLIRRERLREGG